MSLKNKRNMETLCPLNDQLRIVITQNTYEISPIADYIKPAITLRRV